MCDLCDSLEDRNTVHVCDNCHIKVLNLKKSPDLFFD